MGDFMMNGLDAIRRRIREILVIDDRPFSFIDFLDFELDGVKYKFAHGTVRNYFSKLTKSGDIEFAYNSGIAFYTLPGRKFAKQVTGSHMGGPSLLLHQLPIRNTPIYKWLRNRRFDKQALHNLRITFEADGIWIFFHKIHPSFMHNNNQDLHLPCLTFFEYLDIGITIHHSDTVSVSIGCSYRPIALDVPDLLLLIEALTRTEMHLTNEINKSIAHDLNAPRVSVPRFTTWTVKMWHFGVDTLDEYE